MKLYSSAKNCSNTKGDKMTTFKIELDVPKLATLDASRARMIDEEKLEDAIVDWLESVRLDFRANWSTSFKGKNGPESLARALQMDEALAKAIISVVVTQISENNASPSE